MAEQGFHVEISGRGTLKQREALVLDLAGVLDRNECIADIRLQGEATRVATAEPRREPLPEDTE